MSSNPTSTSTARTGRRVPLRAGLAGVALLVALPVLAACSAGTDPEVYQIQPDSGQAKAGYMYISNVWVVLDQRTGNAEVIGQVANTDPTQTNSAELTSVTIGGALTSILPPTDTSQLASGVQAAVSGVSIPGLKSVQFGQSGQPELQLVGADLTVGSNAQVVYTFSNGQTATVTAIVQPNSGLWANYNPNGVNATPAATASASASASASGIGTGTATASSTATDTATATPTDTATGTATASATASSTR